MPPLVMKATDISIDEHSRNSLSISVKTLLPFAFEMNCGVNDGSAFTDESMNALLYPSTSFELGFSSMWLDNVIGNC